MRTPEPLPDGVGPSFNRATARLAGVSEDRLRARDLHRPFRGVRTVRPPSTVLERCNAYAPRLKPGQFFSHTTALILHGYSVPSDLTDESEVHGAAVKPADAPHTTGVLGHRLVGARRPVVAAGLPVTDPMDAFCQVAATFALEDLVVLADEMLNATSLPVDEAKRALLQHIGLQRRVGTARLVRAVHSARRGSRSPAETRVRLTLDAAGIPPAELNAPATEGGTGRYLGSPDFVWRTPRVLLEYEGEDHRKKDRFRSDIVRYDDLMTDGWRVVRATGDDLTREGRKSLVRRTRRALNSTRPT